MTSVNIIPWAILVGIIGFVVWAIAARIRESKSRRLLNEAYARANGVFCFADNSRYIDAHQKEIYGKGANPSEADVLKFLIRFMKVQSESSAMWQAQHGAVDHRAYGLAKSNYQIAYQTYKNNLIQAQARRDGFHYWTTTKPEEPREADFVDYQPARGHCNVKLDHGWIIGACSNDLRCKFGMIHFDANREASALLPKYKDVLEKIADGVLQFAMPDNINSLSTIEESTLTEKFRKEIDPKLNADAEQHVKNRYCKGLEVSNRKVAISTKKIDLPFVVVATLNAKGKLKATLHDHLRPEVVVARL